MIQGLGYALMIIGAGFVVMAVVLALLKRSKQAPASTDPKLILFYAVRKKNFQNINYIAVFSKEGIELTHITKSSIETRAGECFSTVKLEMLVNFVDSEDEIPKPSAA